MKQKDIKQALVETYCSIWRENFPGTESDLAANEDFVLSLLAEHWFVNPERLVKLIHETEGY